VNQAEMNILPKLYIKIEKVKLQDHPINISKGNLQNFQAAKFL